MSFDRMVDPTDSERLHDSDWATERVAWAVELPIVGGVDKAQVIGSRERRLGRLALASRPKTDTDGAAPTSDLGSGLN